MARRESSERLDRQPAVLVRPAEAPWPCAGIAGGERVLEAFVERLGGSEFAEDDVAANVERTHRRLERIDVSWMQGVRIGVQLQHVEAEGVGVPGPQVIR